MSAIGANRKHAISQRGFPSVPLAALVDFGGRKGIDRFGDINGA